LQAAVVQFVSSVTMVLLTFPVASRTTQEPRVDTITKKDTNRLSLNLRTCIELNSLSV